MTSALSLNQPTSPATSSGDASATLLTRRCSAPIRTIRAARTSSPKSTAAGDIRELCSGMIYIEIFNRRITTIEVTGGTAQYASANDTSGGFGLYPTRYTSNGGKYVRIQPPTPVQFVPVVGMGQHWRCPAGQSPCLPDLRSLIRRHTQ